MAWNPSGDPEWRYRKTLEKKDRDAFDALDGGIFLGGQARDLGKIDASGLHWRFNNVVCFFRKHGGEISHCSFPSVEFPSPRRGSEG